MPSPGASHGCSTQTSQMTGFEVVPTWRQPPLNHIGRIETRPRLEEPMNYAYGVREL